MALKCLFGLSGDLAGRLAVVPMSQEARGLDAGPRLAEKLVGCGDNRSAAIVSRIAAEEKAHVAVGETYFLCLAGLFGGSKSHRHHCTPPNRETVCLRHSL